MNKLVPAIVVLAVAIAIGAWLVVSFRAKRKYDEARAELAEHVLSAVPMDAQTNALLTEVRTSWVEEYSEVAGMYADALKTIGLKPSVSNLIEVFTYRLPKYSLLPPGRNKRPMLIGMIQAELLPMSVDQSIHVSDDRHVALIRCRTSLVFVFTDETGGLREARYCLKKENFEHAGPLDQLQPPASRPAPVAK
jgi:hypothetical protein